MFDRISVIQSILDTGLVPLFFHPDMEVARQTVAACADGGAKVVEFTNRGEGALAVFSVLAEKFHHTHPSLILGTGSVLDAPTAALFIAQGAKFIVAPTFNPEIALLCNRRKIPYIPGCATPTEISKAEEAGAEIVKVFPASPELIKAVLGPMPWSRLMPAGGVEATPESVRTWIKAGACGLGVGSQLISQKALASGDYAAIRQGVTNMLGWIQEARGVK
jgi:2-dehydro-3-deoxyphosphogluconate aldolase / (4S)-4-hydroxy-2-oxoglutarate aldolase